jgi:hypothetical protein
MCPVQTVTYVSGRSIKEISWIREGRHKAAFLSLSVGVHMVSTVADVDTTRRFRLASPEAPVASLFRADQLARIALCQSGDSTGAPTGSTAASLAPKNARLRNSSRS